MIGDAEGKKRACILSARDTNEHLVPVVRHENSARRGIAWAIENRRPAVGIEAYNLRSELQKMVQMHYIS
jgi:hypothetical protein